MAPAYTPALWLAGIAFMGNSFYFGQPYKPWILLLVSAIFLIFHNYHAYIIFCRMRLIIHEASLFSDISQTMSHFHWIL